MSEWEPSGVFVITVPQRVQPFPAPTRVADLPSDHSSRCCVLRSTSFTPEEWSALLKDAVILGERELAREMFFSCYTVEFNRRVVAEANALTPEALKIKGELLSEAKKFLGERKRDQLRAILAVPATLFLLFCYIPCCARGARFPPG